MDLLMYQSLQVSASSLFTYYRMSHKQVTPERIVELIGTQNPEIEVKIVNGKSCLRNKDWENLKQVSKIFDVL